MTQSPKKLHIKTFGCQMNAYDSERMAEALQPAGFELTEAMDDADLVILNTCHIREKAAEKVYSELGRVRLNKEARKARSRDTMVAVAGCVAQAEGEEIIARAPVVDIVVGPQSLHRLAGLVADAAKGKRPVETEFPADGKFTALPKRTGGKRQVSAFVTVQEGCDKFCTFCVVPYTRGAEYSRPASEIVAEVEQLASLGVREVTLLGQNVNAYHGDGEDGAAWSLARLLARLAKIPSIARLRFTTSHPRDMDDDLIALFGDEEKLMPYLHLPYQAGSDRILAAMNRKHTAEEYERLIERIRAGRPDIALFDRHHRRLSGRDRRGFPSDARRGQARRLRAGLLVQIQRTAGHAWGRTRRTGARTGQEGTACRSPGAARRQPARLRPCDRRPPPSGAVRRQGTETRTGRRAFSLSPGRLRGRSGNVDRSHRRG
ncbi:MAG: hypothetical protein A49_06400 [Methyloceanibacter sp.]|nr:MAG: hypothetical protein A49_06400 [Methyloceanibacter sp.]